MKAAVDEFVSDHAVLRFLERVYDVDVEAVREAIRAATAQGVAAGAIVDDGAFSVVIDRVRFVIRNGRVVSTMPRDWRPRLKFKARS